MDSSSDAPGPSRSGPASTSAPLTPHPTQIDAAIHERLLRDYKRLKVRVDLLEKENEGLRASLWEVSWRWGKRETRNKQRTIDRQSTTNPHGNSNSDSPITPPSDSNPRPATSTTAIEPTSREMTPRATTTRTNTTTTTTNLASSPLTTSAELMINSELPSSISIPGAGFMRLNEPVSVQTPITSPVILPTIPTIPTTPSSLAASLFPTPSVPPLTKPPTELGLAPRAPSSSSSRTAPSAVPPTTTSAMRDASLKRELDISLPRSRDYSAHSRRAQPRESWRWARGYDLKGHRGAVYALKFGEADLGNRGRVLASAGFDGVRLWGPKDGGEAEMRDDETRDEEAEGLAWDDGDVDEIVRLASHTGPVSDVAFSPSMTHILSGGYDSQLFVHPLGSSPSSSSPSQTPTTPNPTSTSSSSYSPIWSLATDGLVQSVDWLQPHASQGSESGQVFVWGTSGRVLGVGDLRMDKPAMTIGCEAMINAVRSFRRTPTLLVGDSLGSIRHFSLRASAFLPFPESSSVPSTTTTTTTTTQGKKGSSPISCLAVNPDWNGKIREPRWMASVGFDNFIRLYDRSSHQDPLKQAVTPPKMIQTLRGKNRNWPIKTAFYQGREYLDIVPVSKTKRPRGGGAGGGRTSGGRSRSTSFSSSGNDKRRGGVDDEDDDEDDDRGDGGKKGSGGGQGGEKGGEGADDEKETRPRPLKESLLLAVGSSDPVVLIYDLTGPAPTGNGGGEGGNGAAGMAGGSGASGSGAGSTPAPGESGRLVQRLEGHKESVYAVEWLQPGAGASSAEAGRYQGHGMLASAGGDWIVKLWKPVFKEEEE